MAGATSPWAKPPEDTAVIDRLSDRRTELAGAAYALLSALFMTVIMLGTSMAPNYDVAAGAISDLGVIGETALLFNATLIVVGLLNVIGGWLLYRSSHARSTLVVGLLAGLGALGAGLFPLDRGDVHGLSALLAFVFFNIQTAMMASRSQGALRPFGVALALLGLGYVVVMVIGDSGNPAIFGAIGHGGAERLIVYPPMLWLLIYGGSLMARRI